MKVKSLFDKDFENINLKKVELYDRMKIAKRKRRSLEHQKNVIDSAKRQIITRLQDANLAFQMSGPQYKEAGENFSIGWMNYDYWYVKADIKTTPAVIHILNLTKREAILNSMLQINKRSIKGMTSAITRKERKTRYGSRINIR